MDKQVRRICKLAKRQRWRVEQGAKHIKLFDQNGVYRHGLSARIPEGNFRLIRNLEAGLRRAGFKFEDELNRLEEKPVTSVSDLIKANGMEKPTHSPPPAPKPEPKRTRTNRSGVGDEILTVLKGAYPRDVDFTTLKMKVALNQPGVAQPTIHSYLSKLKKDGLVVNVRMGYWRAANADPVAVKPTPAPEVITPVLPEDAQKAIDDLMAAVVNVEKVMRGLQSQLAGLEAVKKVIANLGG